MEAVSSTCLRDMDVDMDMDMDTNTNMIVDMDVKTIAHLHPPWWFAV
jgi:hypothetical protein